MSHCRPWAFALLAVILAGCGSATPTDTGARAALQTFFDALVRHDWPTAYARLDPDTRRHWTPEQFARAAEAHLRDLGFEPEEVHVSSCEEHAAEAEALGHVLLTGHAAGKTHSSRDAVALKRGDTDWGIVLPHNFGTVRRR